MKPEETPTHYDNQKAIELEAKPDGVSDTQVLNWAEFILKSRFHRSNYLTSPNAARDYVRVTLARYDREVFGMILLDNQHGILGFELLFEGTIDAAAVYPREVVKTALEHNAAAVILTHNHPSGKVDPSEADRSITRRLISALETVDIRVLDHLIVAGSETISFAERGILSH